MSLTVAGLPNGVASTPITVHPLVIVNISDHYTRQAARSATPNAARAVGLLLGQVNGRVVEITNSFDLAFGVKGDSVVFDDGHVDILQQKRGLYQTTFPELDVVGWYTTGRTVTATELATVHEKLVKPLCEAPLILLLDPLPPADERKLPVWIVETRKSDSGVTHEKVPFDIESEEAERVGIDAAMKVDENAGANAGLGPQARRLLDAVEALNTRIRVVVAYLTAVEEGKVEPDYELIRRISDVINQLPRDDNPRLAQIVDADKRDALLIAFLGVIAKGTALLSKLSIDTSATRDFATGSRRSLRQGFLQAGF